MEKTGQIGLSAETLRLAIIADDLTGALDAAAPFADRGATVRVATCVTALGQALDGAEVVAVSTRSREVAAEEAQATVAAVLAALPEGVWVFKKVDSRLKGNIAAELAAFPEGPVLAVPALPEFGRVVRDGAVTGFGVAEPIPVAPLLGRTAMIPDVASADEMDAAISAAKDALVIGARGAAVALASRLAGRPAGLPDLRDPLVVAVGSTDPITLAQVTALRAAVPGLRHIPAPDGRAGPVEPATGVTVVQAVPGRGAAGPEVAAALAETVKPLARAAATLVLTGGATAEAVLDGLGLQVLDLHGDLQPGLPLSSAGGLRIVTKSGGFGDADTLVRLVGGMAK